MKMLLLPSLLLLSCTYSAKNQIAKENDSLSLESPKQKALADSCCRPSVFLTEYVQNIVVPVSNNIKEREVGDKLISEIFTNDSLKITVERIVHSDNALNTISVNKGNEVQLEDLIGSRKQKITSEFELTASSTLSFKNAQYYFLYFTDRALAGSSSYDLVLVFKKSAGQKDLSHQIYFDPLFLKDLAFEDFNLDGELDYFNFDQEKSCFQVVSMRDKSLLNKFEINVCDIEPELAGRFEISPERTNGFLEVETKK